MPPAGVAGVVQVASGSTTNTEKLVRCAGVLEEVVHYTLSVVGSCSPVCCGWLSATSCYPLWKLRRGSQNICKAQDLRDLRCRMQKFKCKGQEKIGGRNHPLKVLPMQGRRGEKIAARTERTTRKPRMGHAMATAGRGPRLLRRGGLLSVCRPVAPSWPSRGVVLCGATALSEAAWGWRRSDVA